MESQPQIPEPTDETNRRTELPPKAANKSIWLKTKENASKVASLGAVGATKTAQVGKQAIGGVGEASRSALESGMQALAGSRLASAIDYVDIELEHRGAKQAIKGASEVVVGKLDQVTGKMLVELLEQKLRRQDEYNDILATRLAEALERIAKLEARFCEDR